MSDKKDRFTDKPAPETYGCKIDPPEYCTVVYPEPPDPPYVDEARLAQRLRAGSGVALRHGENGCAILQGKAVPLWEAIEAELLPAARKAWDNESLFPEDLEEEHPRTRLLGFHWQSIGPCMWYAGIGLRTFAGQAFITIIDEEAEFVVAAVAKGQADDAVRFFVEDFFLTNGREYGKLLLNGLPTLTENYSRAISPELLARSFLDVVNWIAAEMDPAAWAVLEETLVAEAAIPDPQQRVLDQLEQALTEGWGEARSEYERERAAEIDHFAKAHIISRYFLGSYREL